MKSAEREIICDKEIGENVTSFFGEPLTSRGTKKETEDCIVCGKETLRTHFRLQYVKQIHSVYDISKEE